jgi:hypothetical protein
MPFKHYTLTLSGAAQNIATALGLSDSEKTLPYLQLIFSADPANANPVYVGDDADVSSTDHGFSLDPTQATAVDKVSVGPFPCGALKLSEFYVIGTANQRLMIAGVPF